MKNFMKNLMYGIALILLSSCSGSAPNTLGVKNNRFIPCPESPNCVSTFSELNDKEHYLPPIKYKRPRSEAFAGLKKIITSLEGKIISETNDYIHAEFTSLIFRFVDDVEIFVPEAQPIIHMKSASRKGRSDFKKNRERIEAIRFKFLQRDY